jgi:hypothetical protein
VLGTSSLDRAVPADYDGDRRADFAIFTSAGHWRVHPSGGGADIDVLFGSSTVTPAPTDYDGDGRADFAFIQAGTWNIRPSTGGADVISPFAPSSAELTWSPL